MHSNMSACVVHDRLRRAGLEKRARLGDLRLGQNLAKLITGRDWTGLDRDLGLFDALEAVERGHTR